MATRILLVQLIAAALLFGGCGPSPQTCNPYTPDGGLFPTTAVFNRVLTTPKQVGSYSISLVNGQVQIIQGNTTAPDALVTVPPGMLAFYFFYGTNNRFVVLDLHTDPSTSPPSITYQPVVVDLTAWSSGSPPQPGHFLSSVSMPTTAQQHIYPSPGYSTTSPGSGLAFFVWYGLGGGQISNAGIYRSDTGAQLCSVLSYTANVQVGAKVVPGAVQILDGGTVIQQCPIPSGSLKIAPSTVNFGSISASSSATQNLTLSNTGNDCLTVSSISSSGPFSPKNFPTNGITLAAGASQTVAITFNPNNVPGTYNATLMVTSAPPVGASSITVAGVATSSGPPQLTVSPHNLAFSYTQGGTVPSPQTVSVGSTSGVLSFTSNPSGGAWLTAPGTGNTPGNVSVSVNTIGLSPNTYNGSVIITSPGASNSPQTIPVTLTVTQPLSTITIGLPADPGQGDFYPFGGYSGRYQQVYSATAFTGPITIKALQFFNTQANSGATSMPSGTWTIALSTTSANWNTLSSNFAANVGSNNTQVFTGNLSQPWAFGKTLTITLSTPFTYAPANGNLLIDVNVSGLTAPPTFVYFDTTGYDGGRRDGSTIIGHVDKDGVVSGYGLVTGFTF